MGVLTFITRENTPLILQRNRHITRDIFSGVIQKSDGIVDNFLLSLVKDLCKIFVLLDSWMAPKDNLMKKDIPATPD